MAFNSLEYAIFLPVVVVVYFLGPARWRSAVLLVAGLLFYASWSVAFLPLLLALTLVNFGSGLLLASPAGRRRLRAWLAVAVAANLGVLAVFKYTTFVLTTVGVAAARTGWAVTLPQPTVILPLAISFFTFEFIHYVVDVGRGHPPERSLLRFAVFAMFFPTQIAGPIKRYQQFLPQLDAPRAFDAARALEGAGTIVRGLFKKVVLADQLAAVVARVFDARVAAGGGASAVDAWLAVLAFGMQVYFDFAGYTDIARGSAWILGFAVPENFRRPYLARSVGEFWRRWHISFSTWLRDYLFVPLGGLRGHPYRALLLTMVLAGLWHGAGWRFAAWGLLHGLLLCAEWAARRATAGRAAPSDRPGRLGALASWAATFVAVTAGWALFRASSLTTAVALLGSLAGRHATAPAALDPAQRCLVAVVAGGCLAAEWWLERRDGAAGAVAGGPPSRRAVLVRRLAPAGHALLLAAVLVWSDAGAPPFIYFRF